MINCAIVGVTGMVGNMFLKVLEERKLPIDEYTLFASKKSAGKKIMFMGKEHTIQELTKNSFDNNRFQYALFSAGNEVSQEYIPIAVSNGCIVIDNSSAFRMTKNVPLVVPEINEDAIYQNNGIIANPNCSTIQAVILLKVLNDKYTIKRIVYSTYQAVSGGGIKGLKDLGITSIGLNAEKFNYKIYNNCLPQIDIFMEDGYTKEEHKMINETRKILNLPDLKITATAVRVPIKNCHGESINVEFEKDFNIDELKQDLNNQSGVVVLDDIDKEIYPINTFVSGKDDVFVGRIRRDFSVKSGINMWVVADNIRKGAATNAIQILEKLIKKF